MGQYAHGNQPVQHAIYLYNWLGQPWKTQKLARDIMNKLYSPNPDGLCGDEDNGQTSAWYVFSAIGFYPVTPGTGQYALGSPLFSNVKLHLENGNTFELKAENNTFENVYINSIRKNNSEYKLNYISYKDIQDGEYFILKMSDTPNLNLGKNEESKPYSMSKKLY